MDAAYDAAFQDSFKISHDEFHSDFQVTESGKVDALSYAIDGVTVIDQAMSFTPASIKLNDNQTLTIRALWLSSCFGPPAPFSPKAKKTSREKYSKKAKILQRKKRENAHKRKE